MPCSRWGERASKTTACGPLLAVLDGHTQTKNGHARRSPHADTHVQTHPHPHPRTQINANTHTCATLLQRARTSITTGHHGRHPIKSMLPATDCPLHCGHATHAGHARHALHTAPMLLSMGTLSRYAIHVPCAASSCTCGRH